MFLKNWINSLRLQRSPMLPDDGNHSGDEYIYHKYILYTYWNAEKYATEKFEIFFCSVEEAGLNKVQNYKKYSNSSTKMSFFVILDG